MFKVSMTRNFVMHRRAKDEPKALFGEQRLWHTFALELAMQACLVKHLGESDNARLLARIARMPRFHSVVPNLTYYYNPPAPAPPMSDPAPEPGQRAVTTKGNASLAPARHEGWLRRLIRNAAKRLR
ncbi:hypothetical protein GCM10009789_43440 [Kribbella sancticallisti]|uniref:Uncharacterized protein n=1 Tax=Kribbella sancticallisti TaxID=460087 RepID=A0ABP4PTJ6_9ACTN